MSPFGDLLRQARETNGVDLDTVTAKTRIPRRYLEALERSDLSRLPGGAFDKGYIRTIAGLLAVDPDPILESYGLEERRLGRGTKENEERMLREFSKLVPAKGSARSPLRFLTRRRWLPLLASVALGSLAAGAFFSMGREAPDAASRGVVPHPLSKSVSVPEPEPDPRPEPVPVPVPMPAPAVSSPGTLTISGSGVGTGLVDRKLMGRGDRFAEGTRVLFWTRVVGGESGQTLRHVWLHEGRAVMQANLPIGGPHWRTFSAFTLPEHAAGPWIVEARGPEGKVLAREEFVCLPPPP